MVDSTLVEEESQNSVSAVIISKKKNLIEYS